MATEHAPITCDYCKEPILQKPEIHPCGSCGNEVMHCSSCKELICSECIQSFKILLIKRKMTGPIMLFDEGTFSETPDNQ